MTANEYLQWERSQLDRHAFHHGEVFAMAGGSPRHNALAAAATTTLTLGTRAMGCRVLSSDQRLAFPPGDEYVYADATVVCGAVRLQAGTSDVVENPHVIVEVLSRSTESYDRGDKWEGYPVIPSLMDYLLVSQRVPRIEHFRRESDGTWRYSVAEAGGRVTLSGGATLDVDELFAGVFELQGD